MKDLLEANPPKRHAKKGRKKQKEVSETGHETSPERSEKVSEITSEISQKVSGKIEANHPKRQKELVMEDEKQMLVVTDKTDENIPNDVDEPDGLEVGA